ncbi:hypothetical protein B0O80DRAFT_479242 [Mortierella sp. GBAus27b]|nr:hypothetical protein B0O80DRAFT_479242 [Mortierella sp. GBAus27b]
MITRGEDHRAQKFRWHSPICSIFLLQSSCAPHTTDADNTSVGMFLLQFLPLSAPPFQTSRPFRVAVIGSGPGGFYTSHRILKNVPQASIDTFEALPVPHGLVRFGVAPDHPEVKNVMSTFDEVAQNPNFTFIGNTSVGTFITPGSPKATLEISDLQPHYDAILLVCGAHEDRLLGIPNEQSLQGVMAARSLVGFYNGLPSEQDTEIDLSQAETAVVIGQGNVAILLTPLEELKKTDLTDKMIKILEKSRVKHVHVIGRRGPLESSAPNTTFHVDEALWASEIERAGKTLDRPRRRLMGLLEKGIKESKPNQTKSWSLLFLRSPLGFQGEESESGSGDQKMALKSIELGINRLERDLGHRKAVATGENETLECGLAFRSIGYKSAPGLYAAGWLKCGPIGVIATTMADAYRIPDWRHHRGQTMLNNNQEAPKDQRSTNPVLDLLHSRGNKTVSYADWKKIEQKGFELGAKVGKPREKFLSVEEMLKMLD